MTDKIITIITQDMKQGLEDVLNSQIREYATNAAVVMFYWMEGKMKSFMKPKVNG